MNHRIFEGPAAKDRLQIGSWDVMAFLWRVSLNIGGIREMLALAACIRWKDRTCVCKTVVGLWLNASKLEYVLWTRWRTNRGTLCLLRHKMICRRVIVRRRAAVDYVARTTSSSITQNVGICRCKATICWIMPERHKVRIFARTLRFLLWTHVDERDVLRHKVLLGNCK